LFFQRIFIALWYEITLQLLYRLNSKQTITKFSLRHTLSTEVRKK